jgi:hypothetical protein
MRKAVFCIIFLFVFSAVSAAPKITVCADASMRGNYYRFTIHGTYTYVAVHGENVIRGRGTYWVQPARSTGRAAIAARFLDGSAASAWAGVRTPICR